MGLRDNTGALLDGSSLYRLRVPGAVRKDLGATGRRDGKAVEILGTGRIHTNGISLTDWTRSPAGAE